MKGFEENRPMTTLLLSLLPVSLFPVLISLTGLALILGIVTRKTAFGFIGVLLLLVLFTPFVDALFSSLPLWLIFIVLAGLAFSLFRGMLGAMFGRGATDHFVGQLMYGVFTLPFRFIGYLIGRRGR